MYEQLIQGLAPSLADQRRPVYPHQNTTPPTQPDIADEPLGESAQLFALPYETVPAESPARPPSDLCDKFPEEPASMRLLGASLVRWLPNIIAAPAIRRRMPRRATDLVGIHAAHLRHHFEERLKDAARELRADLRLASQSTLATQGNALASGVALRKRAVRGR